MSDSLIDFSWQWLANEIWTHIFQYIDTRDMCSCMMTCTEWKIIVSAERKRLDLTSHYNINNTTFINLTQSCPKINYLALKKCLNLNENTFVSSLIKNNPKINQLSLDTCPNISIKNLRDIILHHKYQLISLELKNIKKGSNTCLIDIF